MNPRENRNLAERDSDYSTNLLSCQACMESSDSALPSVYQRRQQKYALILTPGLFVVTVCYVCILATRRLCV